MKSIMFNRDMIVAILEKRKTVTRRLIKPKYRKDEMGFQIYYRGPNREFDRVVKYDEWENTYDEKGKERTVVPPYSVGDILYVRESAMLHSMKNFDKKLKLQYRADGAVVETKVSPKEYERMLKYCNERYGGRFLSPYYLTKEEARLFLKVTSVRAERLQEISEEQAVMEGASKIGGVLDFKIIWDDTQPLNSHYRWVDNPFVWVTEFEVVSKDYAIAYEKATSMTYDEQLDRIEKENMLCDICGYNSYCGGSGVRSGPDGPVYPPCADKGVDSFVNEDDIFAKCVEIIMEELDSEEVNDS